MSATTTVDKKRPAKQPVQVPAVVARLHNVSKFYKQGETYVTALQKVSVEFTAGEFVAIMGPSGSGKSTFLHCAAALDTPSEGMVEIAGNDTTRMSDAQLTRLRRSNVGFIFQAYNLVPILNAKENITLPFQIAGLKAKRNQGKALFRELIQVLDLGDRLQHLPSQLSGGQQQRVAAARALVTRPAILFADEPTGNLDSKSSAELLDFLVQANKNYQQTIVMVTHSAKVACYAKRVIFLADGKIVNQINKPTIRNVQTIINNL